MGVTIKDIARETGLSVTTVSLVLNNKDSRIIGKTRQLVQSTAQELNYQPNQAAVSLVTKKTQVIGLLIAQDHYYYFGDLIRSVEMACHNASYFPLISLFFSRVGSRTGADFHAGPAGHGRTDSGSRRLSDRPFRSGERDYAGAADPL